MDVHDAHALTLLGVWRRHEKGQIEADNQGQRRAGGGEGQHAVGDAGKARRICEAVHGADLCFRDLSNALRQRMPVLRATPHARWEYFLRPNRAPDAGPPLRPAVSPPARSEEHTSELQSLMRTSYAVFYLKKKNNQ